MWDREWRAEDTKNIFIGDYLSKESLNLLHYAKSLKSIGYIHVYTRSTRMIARKSENARPTPIKHEDVVAQLMSEAATMKWRYKPTNQFDVKADDLAQMYFLRKVNVTYE